MKQTAPRRRADSGRLVDEPSVDVLAEGASTRRWPKWRGRVRRGRLGWLVLALGVGWLVIVPLVRLQERALTGDGNAYARLLDEPRLVEVLWTTAALAAGSVALAVTLGTGLAWAAYNLPRRWRFMAILPLVSLMIPPLAQVTGWAFLLAPRVGYLNMALRNLPWWDHLAEGPVDVYSMPAIVFITGFMLVSFVYLFVYTSLTGMDASLTEAARVSGASRGLTFRRVLLPLLRPSLVYSSAIVMLLGLGQFTAPLLLGRQQAVDVVTTEMYRSANGFPLDYGLAAAYGSPIIFIGAVLIVVQRFALRNEGRFETLGARGHRSTTRGSTTAAVVLAGYATAAILLPILAVLAVALSPYWSGSLDVAGMSLGNFREVLGDEAATDAIATSVRSALVTLAFVLPLGYLCAVGLWDRRRPGRRLAGIIDVLVSAPLVLPAVLFGAGILFAYSEGPIVLYGTLAALIVAYVTLTIPHVVRALHSGFVGMGHNMVDAARSCGAGPVRTHVAIVLPALRQSIAAAAALTIALVSHEFAASVMVRTPNTEVMGTVLFAYWSSGSAPSVAVIALVMCAITFVMIAVTLAIGGRKSLEHF